MVAVTGKVGDGDLGVRKAGADQGFDVMGFDRHGCLLFFAKM
jgi:hypothetical protein